MLRRVYMCAITYVYLVSHRDVGGRQAMVVVPAATTFAYLRTAHARNRRATRSTDRDDGERGGRLRRSVGVNRLRVSRLSNAQGIRVRIRGLVLRRAEAQAEAQHQQRD